jgi:selenocysteine-specific elongation factor
MTASRELVIGTAGHIDHGKTALVRALTGVDTDRLPAEKQRGITIDLGFAALELGSRRLAVIDVPGHERFVRNMLAGATGVDLALLVVAADDSVMPQTREHLEILSLLNVPAGVIALTKCDLAEPSWLALVEEEVRGLVAGTFLETAPIVKTSAATGQGLAELRAALERVVGAAPSRGDPDVFRLAIDRSFTIAGHGTVVTGTIASGEVGVGDELEWWPEGRRVRVRGLQQHERPVERLGRGARAAINLGGARHDEIARGQELAATGYLRPSRVLSVALRPTPGSPRPLRHRGRYRLHLGTADLATSLVLLEPEQAAQGGLSLAQLFVAAPTVAVHGEPFVLREESPPATVGGGVVLQPCASRIRRRDRESIERLRELSQDDPVVRTRAALSFRGLAPGTDLDLVRDTGIPLGPLRETLAALARRGELVELPVGGRRTAQVTAAYAAALEGRVLRVLERLHEAKPRHSTIQRAQVTAGLPDIGNEAIIAAIIDHLAERGAVVADARGVALKGHQPKLSQAERRLKAEIAETYRAGGLSPPDPDEFRTRVGVRGNVVAELIALLVDEGRLVEVGQGVYLDAEAEADMKRRVAERLADGSAMTMAALRDLLGTTRKYAVPIGEYLDRIGLTRREGDLRRLGSPGPSPASQEPEGPSP